MQEHASEPKLRGIAWQLRERHRRFREPMRDEGIVRPSLVKPADLPDAEPSADHRHENRENDEPIFTRPHLNKLKQLHLLAE
jgi:hypothetical protein